MNDEIYKYSQFIIFFVYFTFQEFSQIITHFVCKVTATYFFAERKYFVFTMGAAA